MTYLITPSHARIVLSSADGRFTLGPVVGGLKTYRIAFSAEAVLANVIASVMTEQSQQSVFFTEGVKALNGDSVTGSRLIEIQINPH